MNNESVDSVLEFWFGNDTDPVRAAGSRARLWWGKSPQTDTEIHQRFEALLQTAASGQLDAWRATPRGWLALIILCDQFPRNMYRDTPNAFGFDAMARTLCQSGLDAGIDRQLPPLQRVFFYLPLEHAEDGELQKRCVALFETLTDAAAPELKSLFGGFLDFARRHQAIIERFGRFPHRNAILGRDSTPDEAAFLEQPGSSF